MLKYIAVLLLSLALTLNAQMELPAYSTSAEIVRHPNYTLKYNEQYEQPDWVAYRITRDTVRGTAKRPSGFKLDPLVSTRSADSSDYTNSGYDRGHLCPSADFKSDQRLLNETFIMSNITPMLHDFNDGDWGDIEDHERKWAMDNGELFICTGPVLKDVPTEFIGKKNKIGVARRFFKVILDYNEPELKMIAFIVPHKEGPEDISIYAVTVREVEQITGFDFFPALPDDIENRLENELDLRKWGLNPNLGKCSGQKAENAEASGNNLKKAKPETQTRAAIENDKTLFYIGISAGVIVLVVLGAEIFFFLRRKGKRI